MWCSSNNPKEAVFGIAKIKRLPCPTGPTKGHAAVSAGLKGMIRQHCEMESKLGHVGEYASQATLVSMC